MKLSVIIPVYNRANLIGDTIESVLRQSFSDFELIVVDDGSTDNTKDIIDSFKDPRVKYVYQENQGPVVARNTGIKACSGEYLALQDSDDVLLEDAFKKEVAILDRYPEVAFCFGQAFYINEKGQLMGLFKTRYNQSSYVRNGIEEIKDFLVNGNRIGPSMAMIRKDCCIEVGMFDPAFRYGSSDYDLWIRLLKKYPVAYIAEPLVKYRVHSGRITSNRNITEIESKHRLILERIYDDPAISTNLGFEKSKAMCYLYWRLAYRASKNKIIRIYLFKAWKYCPKGLFFKKLFLLWISRLVKTFIPQHLIMLLRKIRHLLRPTTILSPSLL